MVIGVIRQMAPPERSFAWVVAVLAVVATVFWSTSASMVSVWSSSGTYSHGFFIVPAFVWLVWQRRTLLADLPVRPSWWALPVLASIGLAWLLSQWMALALPSQAAILTMVPAAIAGVLGVAWVRALLFPLAFLFFALPVGDSLVPVLMDWTADFTVAALKASGVPVYRDGLHFDIPSGKWSVVDSCSGIRYLFACLAVSSLYGWTIYRSNARRLMFLGLALVIAIVANWVRAYAIVMLGHLSNNQIAAGADHLVYGGVFFAIIMALVFAAGAVWREDAPRGAATGAPKSEPGAPAPAVAATLPRIAAAMAMVTALLIWPAVSIGSASPLPNPSAVAALAVAPRGGWAELDQPLSSWRPVLKNPASVMSRSFVKDARVVGVHIGLFGRSTWDSKLTSAMNRLLKPDGLDRRWKLAQQGEGQARWAGEPVQVRTAALIGSDARLLVWQWYWVDGAVTADPFRASMLQLLARLRGRGEVSAWVTVFTPDSEEPGDASRLLERFVADMSESIDATLRQPAAQHMASH